LSVAPLSDVEECMSQRSSAVMAVPSLGGLARRERRLQHRTRSFSSMAAQRFLANKPATAGLVVIAAMVLLALGADFLSAHVTGHTVYEQSLRQPYAPAGTEGFLLGTDDLGRDIATRLLYGGRVSLGVAGLSIAAALLIGATVGLVAGYFGGWADGVLMRLVDVMLSVPTLFLLLLVATLWTMEPLLLALVIAAVSWTTLARLVRGQVLALREHEYVVAARVMGASNARVMTRHMLPNVLPVMIVWGSLTLPVLILAEATLSYLGLGIQPPQPSWGNMLSNAQRVWSYSAVLVLAPGLAIYITVFAINLVGSGLRDALDPRLTS
jgi:peptide/nickel transport system permease protein